MSYTSPQKHSESFFDWAARQAGQSRKTCEKRGHQTFIHLGEWLMICPICGETRKAKKIERRHYRTHEFTEGAVK